MDLHGREQVMRNNLEICNYSVVTDIYKNVGIHLDILFWDGGMCLSEEEKKVEVEWEGCVLRVVVDGVKVEKNVLLWVWEALWPQVLLILNDIKLMSSLGRAALCPRTQGIQKGCPLLSCQRIPRRGSSSTQSTPLYCLIPASFKHFHYLSGSWICEFKQSTATTLNWQKENYET